MSTDSTTEKPLYKIVQCNLCDKEMTITHLARHMKEIHNTKRVRCYICPKSFKRKEKAINHLRNIHDIKMHEIKRGLLKEVDVPLAKNNNIKPRAYKRKMVQLKDGENFDGVLNSNQIHSEFIKDKILHDDTYDRRKYLDLTEEEAKLLRAESRRSMNGWSSDSEESTMVNEKRSSGRLRRRVRYLEDDYDEDDYEDGELEAQALGDNDLNDSKKPTTKKRKTAPTAPVTKTIKTGKRGRPRKVTTESLSSELLLLLLPGEPTSTQPTVESDDDDDEDDDDLDVDEQAIMESDDSDMLSESDTSFKVTRGKNAPSLPYEFYEKLRLVSFQISNDIGNSMLTITFQFLTKEGKPLTVHLLREHEIKLFFLNNVPNEEFFDRLNEIVRTIELLDSICVTNGEIITTENFGFRYKTFCWTTVNDFMKDSD